MIPIDIAHLDFRYDRSDFALEIPSLHIEPGERVAIVGPSGSGKTTLLNLIAGIRVPRRGTIHLGDVDMAALPDAGRRRERLTRIGMVFQQFELIEYLSVWENILVPFAIGGHDESASDLRGRARQLAEQVGLADKLNRFPRRLSQGEQQRVALCRAMVTRPQLILADEPTGNLDPRNKRKILDLMFDHCRRAGVTLLMVTHDMQIVAGFDRTIDFQQFTPDPGGMGQGGPA